MGKTNKIEFYEWYDFEEDFNRVKDFYINLEPERFIHFINATMAIALINKENLDEKSKFLAFLDWQLNEYCFVAPATLWASRLFSSKENNFSCRDDYEKNLRDCYNQAWDFYYIYTYVKLAVKADKPVFLATNDKGLLDICRVLIIESKITDIELEGKIREIFFLHWGKEDGNEIYNFYKKITDGCIERKLKFNADIVKHELEIMLRKHSKTI